MSILPKLKVVYEILWEAYDGFARDHGIHLSAAVAFYTIFAVAPLTLIATAVTGLFFGRDAARTELVTQIEETLGPESREVLMRLMENWQDQGAGTLATIIGGVTTLYLGFRVFDALRDSLDMLWGFRLRRDISWGATAKVYLRSLVTMFIVGPMLLVSVILSEVMTRAIPYFEAWTGWTLAVGSTPYVAISFLLLVTLFCVIFKWLPDAEIAWRDVLVGAVLTALMFAVGRSLIALYLVHSTVTSVFGAAGSLVVLLFWIYYSAQIVFFGAELTEIFAERFGDGIRPSKDAVPVSRDHHKVETNPRATE